MKTGTLPRCASRLSTVAFSPKIWPRLPQLETVELSATVDLLPGRMKEGLPWNDARSFVFQNLSRQLFLALIAPENLFRLIACWKTLARPVSTSNYPTN